MIIGMESRGTWNALLFDGCRDYGLGIDQIIIGAQRGISHKL